MTARYLTQRSIVEVGAIVQTSLLRYQITHRHAVIPGHQYKGRLVAVLTSAGWRPAGLRFSLVDEWIDFSAGNWIVYREAELVSE